MWLLFSVYALSVGQGEEPAPTPAPAAVEEIQAQQVSAESAAAEPVAAPAAAAEGEQPTWVLQTTRDQLPVSEDRVWHLSGALEYRSLAIVDTDPSNDQYLRWSIRGDVALFPRSRVFLRLGLTQNFWAEEGESGLLLQDTLLGVDYGHEVGLDFIPLSYFAGRKLSLEHRLGLFVPTSRASMKQDMYAAPYILSRARYAVLDALLVGVDGYVRYHFHRYAERAGQFGGMLTQLDFGPSLGVEYTAYDSPRWGSVSVGADLSVAWDKSYASREEYGAPQSSRTFWNQDYGWDAYATYTPVGYFTAVLGVEHGGKVLRDGLQNMFFAHRDETQFFLQLLGRY